MALHRFTPIKQLRVSEEVAEQLKQSIILRHFKAGDKLPSERELSEAFQVSRVAIREALQSLENSGFIIKRQGAGGGAYVTDLTFENLVNAFSDLFLTEKISVPEFYQVRLLVEPEVARLAAGNITPEYAQRLRNSLKGEEILAKTFEEDFSSKTAVHYILAEMCGNRFLDALVRSLMSLTSRIVESAGPEIWQVMHPPFMHVPIVEAVVAGDDEAAARTMKHHAIEFGKNFLVMEEAYRQRQSNRAAS
jgi:GntR family transcriptional repressor for pyruvate dehydrogenase complex